MAGAAAEPAIANPRRARRADIVRYGERAHHLSLNCATSRMIDRLADGTLPTALHASLRPTNGNSQEQMNNAVAAMTGRGVGRG